MVMMKRREQRKSLLTRLKPGDTAVVSSFLRPEQNSFRRLAALGFLPGENFILERNFPCYLIRYGYTRLAINRKTARGIMVYKLEAAFVPRRPLP